MSSKKAKKPVPLRRKVVLPLKIKIEILDRLRIGESFASVSRAFNVNESTVRFIKKSEDKIRNATTSTSLSTKIVRDPAIEKMEAALSSWIEDCNQKMIPLTGPRIREQAKLFYSNFKQSDGKNKSKGFQASEGWYNKFKERLLVHNMKTEEATYATEKYPEQFSELMAEGGYKPEQVFNADETGLFWRRLPNKTLISKHEKENSDLEKDRMTLILCCNASGDCIVKPLLLYRSLGPRDLKYKINLPVFWRANKKSYVTSDVFREWFQECFVPEVENYLKIMKLDFRVVLVLNESNAHSRELQIIHPNVKVIFLPPNTTTLQPMNQGIILMFKLHYIKQAFQIIQEALEVDPDIDVVEVWKKFDIIKCIFNIKESLKGLKPETLKCCWKKLWPVLTVKNEQLSIEHLTTSIAEEANIIGQDGFEDIDSDDIQELLDMKDENPADVDLQTSHIIKEEASMSTEKDEIHLSNLREGLKMVDDLCNFFVKIDPCKERSLSFTKQIIVATSEYQYELKKLLGMDKQEKITKFFKPLPKSGNT